MENTDQILDAPQMETIRLEYAGFWIRTGAYLIDSIILYVVAFVVGLAMADLASEAIAGVINLVIAASYFSVMEASGYQATLGKMAVGIKVGDHNGNPIGVLNSIGRYFGKFISALLLCIGFMMVGWDERNQGIHDKLANTFVFYSK
jgi:uncharacterized RDD family membrane protein YckC